MSDAVEIPQELTSAMALQLADIAPEQLRDLLEAMHTSQLADLLLSCRDNQERIHLVSYIPHALLGVAILELPESLQQELMSQLRIEHIEDVVEHLDSDDIADILQAADKRVADEIISRLEPDERRELEPLMAHDEESAGGLMQTELFKVRDYWTVAKVLTVLRRWGREIDNLNYVYAVDDEDHLTGILPITELLFCEPDSIILGVAQLDFISARAGQDQEEVAHIFDKYDILVLPVLDESGVLVGRITADDILDVLHEEATEDMYRLAALSNEDDLADTVSVTAWRRGVWLAVNLVTAVLASTVVAQFEATISQIVALAVLMPIVASMGGIAGTQTLTVIVRSIALGRVTFDNAKRALIKEVSVSMVTGLFFALVIGVVASIWFPELGMKLGAVIGVAMMVNLCMAGLAGAWIPLTLKRINIDPALASGTILTTVTDVVGFSVFLGLATLYLL